MNNYSFIFVNVRCRDDKKIEAIYKATLALVKDRGLSGITMNDISKEAAIATGTLYIYFKNKEELIKELFQECRTKSMEKYFAGIDACAPFEERLKTVFTNIITYKITHFEVSAFLEQSYHSPFVCITDLNKKQRSLDPLFELVQEGILSGRIKTLERDLIVSFMFGIIHEMVKNSYFSKKKLTASSIDQLYVMFWDAVRLQ
jgi:TetR/AcrR family transcriptional regulator, repressor of fatR-cypB operon